MSLKIMTKYDYQAFLVALLVGLILICLFGSFVWLNWSWYVMQFFSTLFVGLNVLLVCAFFAVMVLIWEEVKFRRLRYQARIDKKQAKIELYKAKASLRIAKSLAATQYAIPVQSGDGVYTNLPLTGHHIPAFCEVSERKYTTKSC